MSDLPPFEPFNKIPRLNRECFVTEKLDGTNAVVYVYHACQDEKCLSHGIDVSTLAESTPEKCAWCGKAPGLDLAAGSKNKWIRIGEDNAGFAAWVEKNKADLLTLGPGWHHGEWHGAGINGNRYGLTDKRFALFDRRWNESNEKFVGRPKCCLVVPILYRGLFDTQTINTLVGMLRKNGSVMYPGKPSEGVVVFVPQSQQGFKVTTVGDEMSKEEAKARGLAV